VGIARPEPCSSSAAVCRTTDTNQPLDSLLRQLNPALKGWCVYFRPGVCSATFAYLMVASLGGKIAVQPR
jgi:RNA-directed DNA polymerase